MNTFKNLFLAIAASSFVLSSCHKDCDDNDDNDNKHVIDKKNLPVTGLQEVPPKTTKAYGSLDVSYNKKTKVLTYKVLWVDLTGIPVGSHIHGEAAKGVNASIKHDFTALIPKATSGTYKGTVVVDEVAIKQAGLLSGLYYVNIHTATFPGGEIRGQIEF